MVTADDRPVNHRDQALHAAIACAHLASFLDPDLMVDVNFLTGRGQIRVLLFDDATVQDLARLADHLKFTERSSRRSAIGDIHHHFDGAFKGFPTQLTWIEDAADEPGPDPLPAEHVNGLLQVAGLTPRAEQVLPSGYDAPALSAGVEQ